MIRGNRRFPLLLVTGALACLACLETARAQPARGRPARKTAPDPAAKAHRVFRAKLREALAPADLERLLADVEQALPDAARPGALNAPLPSAAYGRNPEATYHASGPPERAYLDRQLWADTLERLLDAQLDANPLDAQALADQARNRLPDRPRFADRLLTRGLEAAAKDVAALRQPDLEDLAKLYRKDGGAAGDEKARTLIRRWLEHQRQNRLGPSDAEARIVLAGQYRALLNDTKTAAQLLQETLRIDPQAQGAANTLVNLGYKLVGDRWLEPGQAPKSSEDPATAVLKAEPAGSLIGLTREEVRRKLGKPDRSSRCATQGQVVEQWTYDSGRGIQYVDFARRGRGEATVIFQGSLAPTEK